MTDNATDMNDAGQGETQAEANQPEADTKANTSPELANLLAKISSRIAETKDEEVEEAPMGEMQDRLESLREQASEARAQIKAKEHDPFASVEAALERLSEQVDADARESAAQVWNDDTAEELTNHCEEAGLAKTKTKEDLLIVGAESSVATTPSEAEPEEPVSYVYLQPNAKEIGQQWFEDRFEELAGRLDAAVSSKPEGTDNNGYSDLMAKMDTLEARLTALLGTPEGEDEDEGRGALQDIELCIAEIANQLEATSLELKRIETLEGQIAQLSESLTSQSSGENGGEGSFNAMAIADLVAERIAQNAPTLAAQGPVGTTENINDLSASVKDFIRERRNDGEHANALLDTMQQTIMRLLDRMDTLEKTGSMTGVISSQNASAPTKSRGEGRPQAAGEAGSRGIEQVVASRAAKPPQSHEAVTVPSLEVPSEGPVDPQLAAAQSFGRKQNLSDAPATPKLTRESSEADDDAMSLDRLQQVVGELENVEAGASEQPAVASNPVARNRADFIAAARRAAAKAGGNENGRSGMDAVQAERARLTAQARRIGNDDDVELNDDDIGDEIDATRDGFSLGGLGARFRSKKKKASGRTRLLVVTLTLVAVGLGAGKFIMSQSSDAARQQLQSQQMQQQGSQKVGDKASLPGTYAQPTQMQPAQKMTQRMASPASVTARAPAPSTGAVTIDQNGRFGSLVQPAAIDPAPSQTTGNKPVSGDRGRVSERELPSMLVGPLSLRLAAASGNASAEFQVASRFADGRGVQQDFNEALKWYGRSASRGFALAQYRLGTFHERGLGVPKDIARARIWYQRAAANDNIKAMHNLAVLAASPKAGKPDYTTAAGWFSKAAERGLADSQFNLAILYQNGLGVARSEAEAYKWFNLAASSGDGEAVKRMTELATKLGSKRVQQLDAAARNWRRKSASKMANDPHHAGQAWQRSTSGA